MPTPGRCGEVKDQPTTVSLDIKDFLFVPATITVKVGDVVTWTNRDTAPHGIGTDDRSCKTGSSGLNGTRSLVFNVPGTFPYHCTVHTDMKATIVVE